MSTPSAILEKDEANISCDSENANSVPATFWFVLEMFRNKSHLVRARAEVKACYTSENEFDINMLCKQPFLQSVYAETLRLRTSLFLVRGADHGDFHLQNCTFGRGKMIAIDTGAAHTDHKVWNTGNPDSPKGADTFWAERFLVDPQDPYSGPLKPSQKTKALSEKDTSSEKAEGSTKFTMKGLDGAWIPFGGGVRQCPGKQFAKQEIILSFAILCTAFDIELLEEKNYVSDMRYYGLGGMPVKGKVPFKIRLRAG